MRRMPNEKKCYEKYLDMMGFTKQNQPIGECGRKLFLSQFITDGYTSNGKTYVVKTSGHLTVVKENKILDTWNCGGYKACNYWSK